MSKPSRGNGRHGSAGRKKTVPREISRCSYRPHRASLQCSVPHTRAAPRACFRRCSQKREDFSSWASCTHTCSACDCDGRSGPSHSVKAPEGWPPSVLGSRGDTRAISAICTLQHQAGVLAKPWSPERSIHVTAEETAVAPLNNQKKCAKEG
jgi:hypothetical protein